MSFFRLLSPRPPGQSSRGRSMSKQRLEGREREREFRGSTPDPTDDLQLLLHVPSYGGVWMNRPNDPLTALDLNGGDPSANSDEPRNDVPLSGELEVVLPPEAGRRKCKGLKVGVKVVVRLDIGPGRMGEEDTIFDRSVDIHEDGGVWLEPGSQRFSFTIILPNNIATHDWHNNARISCWLYADLLGAPAPPPMERPKSKKGKDRSQSRTPHASRAPSRIGSRAASRASSPSRKGKERAPNHDPLIGIANGLDLMTLNALASPSSALHAPPAVMMQKRHSSSGPASSSLHAPPYEVNDSGTATGHHTPEEQETFLGPEWIVGDRHNRRVLFFVYNPNRDGGVTSLDERANGYVDGLGPWELRLVSDVWTICAHLICRITLPSLAPTLTLFYARCLLQQTHTITSPRRTEPPTKPITQTRFFTILEQGTRPPKEHLHPDVHMPAVWRGVAAGGKDGNENGGEWRGVLEGRLPNDDNCRPSTLPEIETPVRVTHSLITEIFFSVHGEDQYGRKMNPVAAGGLRVMRASRPVVLPSCAFINKNVRLPTYEEGLTEVCPHRKPFDPNAPPPSGAEHHPSEPPPTASQCELCQKLVLPGGTAGWRDCACGMTFEEIAERSRRMEEEEEAARRGRARGRERVVRIAPGTDIANGGVGGGHPIDGVPEQDAEGDEADDGEGIGDEYRRGRKAAFERSMDRRDSAGP